MSIRIRGRAVRAALVTAALGSVVLAGTWYVWELRGIAAHRADGNEARGAYRQDPERADRTAFAVLESVTQGDPEPVPAGEGFGAAATAPARAPDWRPSDPLEARPAPAEPAIGALFSPGNDADPDHHCTASVVHSPAGDLIATAAHCVYGGGFRTNLAFAPGYRDGAAPYGIWVPTRIDVDPRWIEDQDPDHDIAFVRLRRPGNPGQRLEDVTGAQTIRFRPELPVRARLVGYPNDSEEPLECRNTAVADGPAQLRLDCADVPNGSSGGPVLTDGHTLIGIIGGRDGGGDEETSYSSYLGDAARALYERATNA
ncbi:trypsin-like serine peptidase [Streptomyces sp. NPDC058655]|uniref:trypsin-like serine peptidase n=1 Tax=unclassified Streptomyces TaxID=2593676 RepID=UPI0036463A63